MSFIIAKDYLKQGSIVYQAPAELDIASTVRRLEDQYEETDMQLVTTGRLDVYKEYEPFKRVDTLESFEAELAQLTNQMATHY